MFVEDEKYYERIEVILLAKIEKTQLEDISDELKMNPKIDLGTFQNLVKILKKLPEEKLELVVGQIGNFTEIVKTYMGFLNDSLTKNHELVEAYQESLLKQLEKEDSIEIKMQVLADLRELQKKVGRRMTLDKLQLDKVATAGVVIVGAVITAIVSSKNKS